VKPVRWYHAFAVSDQGMKTATLDERRVEHARTEVVPDSGWHLSYFMALNDIARKARPLMPGKLFRQLLRTQLQTCMPGGGLQRQLASQLLHSAQ